MHYLLDTNTAITAKNEFYAFEIAPGFWTQLEGKLISEECALIDAVEKELLDGNDELTTWIKDLKNKNNEQLILKAKDDPEVIENYRRIAELVYNDSKFKPRYKENFLSKADPWIIAAAKAWGDTVVTFEKMPEPNSTKVKIPDICKRIEVSCITLYEMMRTLKIVLRN